MSDDREIETPYFRNRERAGPEATMPPRRDVSVEFGAASDIGKVRPKNQDHYLVTRIGRTLDVLATNIPERDLPTLEEDSAYGMVVADGMGGMAAGEKASLLAIRTGLKLVLASPRWALRIDEHEVSALIGRMQAYFHKVDETLIEETRVDPKLTGMATTLTVVYSVGTNVFIVHAGDSRAYLFRGGALRQLTRDHRMRGTTNVVTNFAGGPALGIFPEISTLEVADGDRLLLCTDGLFGMVADPDISAILARTPDPRAAARALVDRALDRGGKDNVTVVVAGYSVGDHSS